VDRVERGDEIVPLVADHIGGVRHLEALERGVRDAAPAAEALDDPVSTAASSATYCA
jgi:hypothetical protein